MKLRKIVFLLAICLMFGKTAFCAQYVGDNSVSYDIFCEEDENADFIRLLKKLGIFDGEYLPQSDMKYKKVAEIFGVEINSENADKLFTNEDFMCFAAKSFDLKAQKLKNIYDFYDFSLIKPENRIFAEAYLEKFYAFENSGGQMLLRPKKIMTEKEFFLKLRKFDEYLAEKYGYSIYKGKISDFSLLGNTKTLCLTDGTEVVTKNGDLLLITGGKTNRGNSACVFVKEGIAYAVKITHNESSRFKTGGIYKGNVFLYDKSGGKIVFKNLKQYSVGEFVGISADSSLTVFDAFSNFLVYENYYQSSSEKINNFLLDKEAVFFTMTDEYGVEKVCYIIYVE